MCGRYTLHHTPEEIAERFAVQSIVTATAPRYNIAPTQMIPVIRQMDVREMIGCKWGLVPFWAKDPSVGNKMINAKAETLAEKPSFKYALEKRRCLIPADGFYEWDKSGGKGAHQPMYIRRRDGGLFALAGLWEECRLLSGETLRTCTIITVAPNELIAPIHHRMAALLRPADEAAWLRPQHQAADVLPLLRAYPANELEAFPVARAVNSPVSDNASCIQPLSG